MKRSPLKRGTSRLARAGRLKSRSKKAEARHASTGAYRAAKDEVRDRSKGRCEIVASINCTGYADDGAGPHHRWMTSQGGPDIAENLRDTCAPCHGYVHAHPAVAYEAGWLLHAWSEEAKSWAT